ncbi:MAG: Rid family detoxifying hydrolase [Planctomycetes bacterium]|nr:Rid family detoxifying hydrolase [Planctomycetota bacterium]
MCLVAGCATHARVAVESPAAPRPIGPYSQAIRVGDQIWCAGQLGVDPASGELVLGGIVAETRRAFENVEAVLAAAGATRDDIVAVNAYLTDLAEFADFNAEFAKHVSTPPPARATVQVAKLPKNARVELQVVAVRAKR